VKHPKFEGHVTPNEDEYIKNLSGKNVDIVLEYHNSPLIFSLHAYRLAEEIDFEIGRFCNFWSSVTLTCDRVIWHTAVYHSLTSTYLRSNWKNFMGRRTYGWTVTETGFIGWTSGVDRKQT